MYATSAGRTASDGQGRNGLFTSQLLKNLKTPGLEVKEIFNRTGSDVRQVSGNAQIPEIHSQFFGNAYLSPVPAQTAQNTPAPAARPAPQPAQPAARPAPAPAPASRPAVAPQQPAAPNSTGYSALKGAVDNAAKSLIGNIPRRSKVAILNVVANDRDSSRFVIEELASAIINQGSLIIVDEGSMDKVRQELGFQMNGEWDDASSMSIGRLLGAKFIITGSITSAGSSRRLQLRAIDVETNAITAMVSERF
jgi:TolB-like protein